jgi:hypothetical protein
MRIRVDDEGFPRPEAGAPKADVCLHSDEDTFFHFYITQVLSEIDGESARAK